MNMVSAVVAAIGWAAHYTVMLRDALAILAINAI
jgi:hypothetical protein